MLYKLDLKDKRILYELDSNARQTCSEIGKKVGLSTEVVNYRIKKLEENEIITQYQVIVNLSKLGIIQFKLCLCFEHLPSERLHTILVELKKKEAVKWIVTCKGHWELIISLETDSLDSVVVLKEEVLSLFEGHINEYALALLTEAVVYERNYLIPKSVQRNQRIIMKKDKPVSLEKIDLDILKKLSINARSSALKIANEIKSTPRIVSYRINQLAKLGIIQGYRIALNYQKSGIQYFKAFVSVDNPSKERLKSLTSSFEQQKNITHHVKVLGFWDFEPEFEAYSEKEITAILTDIKDRFSDIIKKIDVITVVEEYKYVYY